MGEPNFGFLLNDRIQIHDLLTQALARRKQLCPFPLEPHEMLYVQHHPEIAKRLEALIAYQAKLLHWGKEAYLRVADEDGYLHKINFSAVTALPLATSLRVPAAVQVYQDKPEIIHCWNGPETARLREWAWAATQVELENRWAMKIIDTLVRVAATHQQVHRYMPELYNLLQNQAKPLSSFRRFVELHQQLNETGSSRARKIEIPQVSVKDRSNLKALVVHTMLLPPHNGNAKDTEFDQTWVDP